MTAYVAGLREGVPGETVTPRISGSIVTSNLYDSEETKGRKNERDLLGFLGDSRRAAPRGYPTPPRNPPTSRKCRPDLPSEEKSPKIMNKVLPHLPPPMASSLFRNQKTMRNEEKPARRTRRSFLKKSAMAGMGAQSTLIFSGLVMTSYASGGPGSCTPDQKNFPAVTTWKNASGTPLSVYQCDSGGVVVFCTSDGQIFTVKIGGTTHRCDRYDSDGPYTLNGTTPVHGAPTPA